MVAETPQMKKYLPIILSLLFVVGVLIVGFIGIIAGYNYIRSYQKHQIDGLKITTAVHDEFLANNYRQLSDLPDDFITLVLQGYANGTLDIVQTISENGSTVALVSADLPYRSGMTVCGELCFLIVKDDTSTRIAKVFSDFKTRGGISGIEIASYSDATHVVITDLSVDIDPVSKVLIEDTSSISIDISPMASDLHRAMGTTTEITQPAQ